MRGLNRVEVLVILFAGVVMLALAVPWLLTSRGSARDHHCSNNLRQLHIAFDTYAAFAEKRFPFGTHVIADLPPEKRLSWTVMLLPFNDGQRRYSFDLSKPWDDPANTSPVAGVEKGETTPIHRFGLFRCPDDENDSPPDEIQYSSYIGMAGVGKESPALADITPQAGLWGYNRQTRFEQILDGREHTVNLLETSRNNGPWTAGGPPTLRPLLPDDTPPFGPGRQFGGHHVEGTQVLFADGAVKMQNNAMDATVFEKLCTIAGQ